MFLSFDSTHWGSCNSYQRVEQLNSKSFYCSLGTGSDGSDGDGPDQSPEATAPTAALVTILY